MPVLMLLFAASVVVPIVVGIGLATSAVRPPGGGPSRWGVTLAQRFGRIPAAVGIAVAGWLAAVVLTVPLGLASRATEAHLDRRVFKWVTSRVHHSEFTKLNSTLTQLGNRPITDLVMLVAIVILAFAYGRRWWLPVVSILGADLMQREAQIVLGKLVHRDRPPVPGSGVFPSGGVLRLICIFGVVILLSMLLLPGLSKAWRTGMWVGLATFGALEAYTRVYLSDHWVTDAISGLCFGTLLLLTLLTAVYALAAPPVHPDIDARTTPMQGFSRTPSAPAT